MGEYPSKNKKANISEEVSCFDVEWQKLVSEEKEKNDPKSNNDLVRFSTALEYGERNRYGEVLALESTRVKLLQTRNDSDYINANYVDGILDDSIGKYISAQAPLPQTFSDFWSMLWEQQIYVVVMLTNLNEGGKIKAHPYWPDQSTKQYGDIFVTCKSEEEYMGGDFIKRTFSVSKNIDMSGLRVATLNNSKKMERKVVQYHYTTWPDHGAPVESDSILELIKDLDAIMGKKRLAKKTYFSTLQCRYR